MMRTRTRLLVVPLAVLALLALNASAATAVETGRIVLRDRAGDANGINDQSEGLVRNFATPRDVREADVRSVAMSPLRDASGAAVGYRLAITTTRTPGTAAATGTPLSYGVIMQVTSDCRIGVYYAGGDAVLRASCDNDPGLLDAGRPLKSRIMGYQVMIDVPYSVGPPDMRPGEGIEYTGVLSQFAPVAGHTGARLYSTQLDNAGTTSSWTLPR